MLLGATTDKLELTTSTAANIDVLLHYADMDDTTKAVTVDRQVTAISSATTTEIASPPASGFSRKVNWISICNRHGSLSNTITLLYDANGTDFTIESATLAFGERCSWSRESGMRFFDSEGREKLPSIPRASGAATIAAIASHSADTYYLGFPVTGRLQAGSFFRWTWGATKGAGTAAPTFNIRFGTAGTTADTSRCLMTGTAQTAVADSGYFVVEAIFRSIGSGTSAVIQGSMHLHHALAVTGFNTTVNHMQLVQTTGGGFDSTVANSIIGLSVNPGTSGAWVANGVCLDGVNLLP